MCFESIGRIPLVTLAGKIDKLIMDHAVELLEIEVEKMGHDGACREEVEGITAVVLFLGVLLADHAVVALEVVKGEVVAFRCHNCIKG